MRKTVVQARDAWDNIRDGFWPVFLVCIAYISDQLGDLGQEIYGIYAVYAGHLGTFMALTLSALRVRLTWNKLKQERAHQKFQEDLNTLEKKKTAEQVRRRRGLVALMDRITSVNLRSKDSASQIKRALNENRDKKVDE